MTDAKGNGFPATTAVQACFATGKVGVRFSRLLGRGTAPQASGLFLCFSLSWAIDSLHEPSHALSAENFKFSDHSVYLVVKFFRCGAVGGYIGRAVFVAGTTMDDYVDRDSGQGIMLEEEFKREAGWKFIVG